MPSNSQIDPKTPAQPIVRRSILAALFVCFTTNLTFASTAAAQTVHGRLTDGTTGTGIDRALIVIIDDENFEVNRTITAADGSFSVTASVAGQYRVRTERIGFRSTVSDLVQLGPGETRTVDIRVRPIVIRLDTIRIDGDARDCRVTGEQGLATATVWEEARKHLDAVAWSTTDRQFNYAKRDFERRRDRSGTVTNESDSLYSGTYSVSYQSRPIGELQKNGYASIDNESYTFFAPDAQEFFSEEFLRGHCFSLTRDDDLPGLIGLAFEPVAGSDVTDIRGVFWLDEVTSTTRYLEFRYTKLSPRVYEREAKGRVEFEQIPNGPWFVSRWWIRVPQASLGLAGQTSVVHGFKEAGGEVVRVSAMDGRQLYVLAGLTALPADREAALSIGGTVLDSESRLPIEGVTVLVDGTARSEATDSSGSFRLDDFAPGSHALVFMKDGHTARTYQITVNEGQLGRADIGTLLLTRGPAPTANISGTVRDSLTGLPVHTARVHVNGVYVAATNGLGGFQIPAVQLVWGSNLIEFRRIGYTPKQAELWTARENQTVETEIELMPLAVQMAEVVVEGERTIYHLGRSSDFVRRSRAGLGSYFTEQDIEERQPYVLTDLLRSVPGILVSPTARGNIVQILRRGGCSPVVFLDGVRLANVTGTEIDDLTSPENVAGVEVYKGAATVPAEFGFINNDCGVVAIWTKR